MILTIQGHRRSNISFFRAEHALLDFSIMLTQTPCLELFLIYSIYRIMVKDIDPSRSPAVNVFTFLDRPCATLYRSSVDKNFVSCSIYLILHF